MYAAALAALLGLCSAASAASPPAGSHEARCVVEIDEYLEYMGPCEIRKYSHYSEFKFLGREDLNFTLVPSETSDYQYYVEWDVRRGKPGRGVLDSEGPCLTGGVDVTICGWIEVEKPRQNNETRVLGDGGGSGSGGSIPSRGKCLLEVDNRRHFSGRCRYFLKEGENGRRTFTVEPEDKPAPFVRLEFAHGTDKQPQAFWTGSRDKLKKFVPLASLTPVPGSDPCWVGRNVRICTWIDN